MIKDIFIDLHAVSIDFWIIRLVAIPLAAFMLTWLLHMLLSKFEESEMPIFFKRRLALNKSLIFTLFLTNAYWFALFQINGISKFDFGVFPLDLKNVYFSLIPLLFTHLGVISWYYFNKQQILKNI
jgi:hypothetical protein